MNLASYLYSLFLIACFIAGYEYEEWHRNRRSR